MDLWRSFWNDDCGGIIATEYVFLATLVTVGTTAGLVELRDATTADMRAFNEDLREARKVLKAPSKKPSSRFQPPQQVPQPEQEWDVQHRQQVLAD
jgi:hypothetical protein